MKINQIIQSKSGSKVRQKSINIVPKEFLRKFSLVPRHRSLNKISIFQLFWVFNGFFEDLGTTYAANALEKATNNKDYLPFLRSSGLPFLTVANTISPTAAAGRRFKRPLIPLTAIMYKFLAPEIEILQIFSLWPC